MAHDASDFRPARRIAGLLLALVALLQVARTVGTLGTSDVYRKDLLQDYVAARAILDGDDPYQPMLALRSRYVGPLEGALAFPHPTPHPPPALLLALPLGLVSYSNAAAAWLAFEYLLLAAVSVTIARCVWKAPGIAPALLIGALALCTSPVRDDLFLGQFGVVILAFLVGSYAALTARRSLLGGVLLGAAVSLKFLCWPVVLFYAWKRRWGVVLAASAALLAAHAASALVIHGAANRYYVAIAPQASAGYAASDLNISVWTVGQRVFGGLSSQATMNRVVAPPIIARPEWARPAGSALALATLLVTLYVASKRPEVEDGFLVMMCVSTVLNPIAWEAYLTLLVLPLAVVGLRLAKQSWPRRATWAFAVLVIALIALKTPGLLVLGEGTEMPVSAVRALVGALALLYPFAAAWLVVSSGGVQTALGVPSAHGKTRTRPPAVVAGTAR